MIRSLQIFRDLVESQSFTETGRRNYVTQSAVSQHLKTLEQKFGRPLLERRHRQVTLTSAGRLVYEAAREILWRYQQLERSLARPSAEVSGSLLLAASLTVGLYELPPLLTEFLRRYPNVDLKVNYFRVPEVYQAVLQGRADVGLVAFPEPHPQLTIRVFTTDRLVLVVPPDHPLAKRRRVSLKRLRQEPFIAVQTGSHMREAIDRILQRTRTRVRIAHEFDNLELIKRAVEIGSGVSILPAATVLGEVSAGLLSHVEIAEGPLDHPVGILTRRFTEPSLAAQKLIASLLMTKRPQSF